MQFVFKLTHRQNQTKERKILLWPAVWLSSSFPEHIEFWDKAKHKKSWSHLRLQYKVESDWKTKSLAG